MSIDEDRRTGRFVLAGAANILPPPQMADSLVGRMEVHTLLRPCPSPNCKAAPATFCSTLRRRCWTPAHSANTWRSLKKSSLLGACLPGGATLETWVA